MTLSRAAIVRLAAVAWLPAVVLSADPATRPAVDARSDTATKSDAGPATRPAGRATLFGNRMLRLRDLGLAAPDWPNPGGNSAVSEEEWATITGFAKANFPNRWALFEQLEKRRGRDNGLVKQLRDRITGRYRLLMRIQRSRNVPAGLYEAALTQGRLEDDAWAAVNAARRRPNDADAQKRQREKVQALVKSVLAEKQNRLQALEQTLAEEKKQLEADKADLDKVIDRQIARLSGDDPAAGRNSGFGRGWDRPEPGEYRYTASTTQP